MKIKKLSAMKGASFLSFLLSEMSRVPDHICMIHRLTQFFFRAKLVELFSEKKFQFADRQYSAVLEVL
jgi:hypothetical protein